LALRDIILRATPGALVQARTHTL